jgi:AcrR family transcriptional regulator
LRSFAKRNGDRWVSSWHKKVELVEQGKRPTVAEVAEAALVSRATAYRYFPTQEYLLFEAALESTRSDIDRELDENRLPDDPEARLEMMIDALQKRIIDKEAVFRTMLRLSLEQSSDKEQYGGQSPQFRLRGGGRVRWIEKALASAGLSLAEAVSEGMSGQQAAIFLAGSVSSAVVAYLAIKFLLRFLVNHSLRVFAYYRFVLAAVVAVALLSASS